jgi:hypothetical protein
VAHVIALNARKDTTVVAKYYIKCGTLELIYSTDKFPMDAAISALWETNEHDVLEENFYIDQRGMRDKSTADGETITINSDKVLEAAGWEIG